MPFRIGLNVCKPRSVGGGGGAGTEVLQWEEVGRFKRWRQDLSSCKENGRRTVQNEIAEEDRREVIKDLQFLLRTLDFIGNLMENFSRGILWCTLTSENTILGFWS